MSFHSRQSWYERCLSSLTRCSVLHETCITAQHCGGSVEITADITGSVVDSITGVFIHRQALQLRHDRFSEVQKMKIKESWSLSPRSACLFQFKCHCKTQEQLEMASVGHSSLSLPLTSVPLLAKTVLSSGGSLFGSLSSEMGPGHMIRNGHRSMAGMSLCEEYTGQHS